MSKEEEFSDDELDELFSDHEDVKPSLSDPNTLLRGSLQRPRHVMFNTKHLHGESTFIPLHMLLTTCC